ncbi:MAG: hypothetical protein EXQ85_01395 [Alphaproteobacteria bacterium]|nr:hypothetical protein [Alphaproteobacteria bacterium]
MRMRIVRDLARVAPALVTLLAVSAGMVAGSGAARAQEAVTITVAASGEQLPATLRRPAGEGPFPAVTILHDCNGVGPRSSEAPRRWANDLRAQGYVVIIPDSFTPRGLPDGICTEPPQRSRTVDGNVRAGDAYAALAFLHTLAYVDGRRVGVMGGSHGGRSTLAAMVEPVGDGDPLAVVKRDGFAAGIALYPACAVTYGRWMVERGGGRTGSLYRFAGVYRPTAPLLLLVGEIDDWAPAAACRELVEAAQAKRAAGRPEDLRGGSPFVRQRQSRTLHSRTDQCPLSHRQGRDHRWQCRSLGRRQGPGERVFRPPRGKNGQLGSAGAPTSRRSRVDGAGGGR